MTPIASQLEAALPANDDDNGPVTLPASVVRCAARSIRHESAMADKWHQRYHEAREALTDQQNARWLAWLLAGIAIGAAMVGYIGWVS